MINFINTIANICIVCMLLCMGLMFVLFGVLNCSIAHEIVIDEEIHPLYKVLAVFGAIISIIATLFGNSALIYVFYNFITGGHFYV